MTRFSRLIAIATLSALVSTIPVVAHGAPDVYVVKNGDSLSHIAGKLGVRLADLLRANDLRVTSVILPGQRLDVPGTSTNPSPAAAGSGSYTVRAGDALSVIAARHDISLAGLLSANNLTVNSVIHPGQRLAIPGGTRTTNQPAAPVGAGNYTVRPGDALGLIAARHDISLAALLSANNLTVNSVIHPGQRLTIPGRTPNANQPRSTSGGAAYTVRPGDALGLIAARHDISLAALLRANNLTAGSIIHPGDQLTLPAGATGRSVQRVLAYALAQVGKPYRFFSAGPYAFDCSGLTLAAYARVGVTLVHHSASQARQGTPVDFFSQSIRAGDLVFISTNGSGVINHVGIAINDTSWVQARRPGVGVRITAMPPDSVILAVRRFLPAA